MDSRGTSNYGGGTKIASTPKWMVVTPIKAVSLYVILSQDNNGGDPDLLPTGEIKPRHQIRSNGLEVRKV